MELTYTDSEWRDVGLVTPTDGDFAWGEDENDFSVDVRGTDMPPEDGLLYLEGSDVGGIVRGYGTDPTSEELSVVGDTWTGVLDSHVLRPDAGQAYYKVSGDARDCVARIVTRLGLDALFRVAAPRTGISVSHTFTGSRDSAQDDAGRYMGGWQAIWQLLVEHGLCCSFAWSDSDRRVVMTVAPRHDLTDSEAQSVRLATVGVARRRPTNHLVCLGKGDLAAREVLDLYADSAGNVSTRQTFKGVEEVADVYDLSASESGELRDKGESELRKRWQESQTVTIGTSDSVDFRLGDLVGGTDERSGVSAEAVVSKRVLSFRDGEPSWSYTSTVRG